jgi:ribosomal protein L30E
MSLVQLKKALESKKLKIGIEETVKLLKNKKVKEVFVSSTCSEDTKKTLKKYCKLSDCKFSELKEDSKDLGAVCKKLFSISVCSYLK